MHAQFVRMRALQDAMRKARGATDVHVCSTLGSSFTRIKKRHSVHLCGTGIDVTLLDLGSTGGRLTGFMDERLSKRRAGFG